MQSIYLNYNRFTYPMKNVLQWCLKTSVDMFQLLNSHLSDNVMVRGGERRDHWITTITRRGRSNGLLL